jgi:hypothetical protein|nr:MAG TPA: hypothetical protein [Caudoviricetes sp.]
MALSQDQAEKFLGLMTEMLGAMNSAPKEESQDTKQPTDQAKEQAVETQASSQQEVQQEQKTEQKPEEKQKEVKNQTDDSAEKLVNEAQTLLVKAQFVNAAAASGLDNSTVETLHDFISYDKLINDKGEPDKEQINKLVSQLKGVATSQPPKSNNKQQLGSDNGLGKYIQ